ncbi:CPBP family intramembrane glutamic endopeptidase [Ancylomarina sp. YFZ004]
MSKLYLWSEFVAIFFVVPLLYFFELIPIHKSIPLVVVFIYCLVVMYNKKNISRRIFRIKSFLSLKEVAVKSLFLLVISSLWVYIFREDVFFHLPLNNFWFWIFLVLTYPIWSAFTQEFIYRFFFYQRYRILFDSILVMIFVNALCFSMAHIIFRNWVALVFTFVGSIVFSLTYIRSKSLNVVFIEHSIYGNIFFTNGFGIFFYLPL